MGKTSKQLYHPKTAFGNPKLLEVLTAEREEEERKQAIANCHWCHNSNGKAEVKCDLCDGEGEIKVPCDQCNGVGRWEVPCEHGELPMQ